MNALLRLTHFTPGLLNMRVGPGRRVSSTAVRLEATAYCFGPAHATDTS